MNLIIAKCLDIQCTPENTLLLELANVFVLNSYLYKGAYFSNVCYIYRNAKDVYGKII